MATISKKPTLNRMYITKIKDSKTKKTIGWDLKEVRGKNRLEFKTQTEAIAAFQDMNVDARVWVTSIKTGKFKYTIVSKKIKGASKAQIRASKKVYDGDKEVDSKVFGEIKPVKVLKFKLTPKPKPVRKASVKKTFAYNPRLKSAQTREQEREKYIKEMNFGIEQILAKAPSESKSIIEKVVVEPVKVVDTIKIVQPPKEEKIILGTRPVEAQSKKRSRWTPIFFLIACIEIGIILFGIIILIIYLLDSSLLKFS